MRNILIIFFLLTTFSCDNKRVEINPKVDSYPMTVGTEWIYDREIIIKKYESETSDQIINTDKYNFTVRVWVDKDTLLKDTIKVMVFKAAENNDNWTFRNYKLIDNEGLKNLAYSGSSNFFAKKKGTLKLPFILYFNSLLENMIQIDDEIIYEEQPTLDIKFPLINGSSWIYRHSKIPEIPSIEKEVIGTERLNLAGENFDCFKVYWNNLNITDTGGIKITDWISNKGLIKRIEFFDRIYLRNEFGEYSDEPAQITETLVLKELKIN